MSESTGDITDGDIPFGDPNDPSDGDGGDRAEDRIDPKDMMSPPRVACECYCLHCQRTFSSEGIWLQRVINGRDGVDGFWMCPTPNCDGAGFTFDIFPTDPAHPANSGWHYCDDDDDELEFDENGETIESSREKEYDPEESKYKALDEALGDAADDIIEGDEWKLAGLEPQPPFPESESQRQSRLEWEEEQESYDAPDERPRVIDWKDRDEPTPMSDEDIPF